MNSSNVLSLAARWSCALLLCVLGQVTLAAPLTVTPASGSLNTKVSVRASGLAANASYTLEFAGNGTTNVASLTSDAAGRIGATRTLPALPAGVGKMRLKSGALGGPVVGYTAFTALAALTFTPLASNVHAGQSIRYSVGNVRVGSLTVLYEGLAVAGPLAVSQGTYNGGFVVPTDRPSPLPANARITVQNKVGRVVVAELQTTLAVLPRLSSPFQIGITQAPPNQVFRGQRFNVTGQFTLNANEATPEQVSLWFAGTNGEVFPLAAAVAVPVGNQLVYTMSAAAAGGLSMTAGAGDGNGRVFVASPTNDSVGMTRIVQVGSANPALDVLPQDRWGVRVRVQKQNGQPIAGALVQFDGAPAVDTNTSTDGTVVGSIGGYVLTTRDESQYSQLRATDSRGCPLTFGRKLTDANGIVDFEFLDSDLALAQISLQYDGNAGGGSGDTGQPRRLLMAIDAASAGYGFQIASGPDAGDYVPQIYNVQFIGAGDADPSGDVIVFTDNNTNVEIVRAPRNSIFTQALPLIVPQVGLYDTSALPWIANTVRETVGSGTQQSRVNRLVFGPVYSQRGVPPAWVEEQGSQAFPSTIAVRTNPAISGVVTTAKLFLNANRNGAAEFVADFIPYETAVDCSISGINTSITWRADLSTSNIRQQAGGRIQGYLEFKGSATAGKVKQYIGIDMQEQDLSWLSASKYTEREVEYLAGGQSLHITATEDTADAEVELDQNPGYEIGHLRNATANTRYLEMVFNNTGSQYIAAPLGGAHREAGRVGTPTMLEPTKGVGFHENFPLFDQSVPLFYYVWGVPVLAGIEVGADLKLKSEIDIDGKFILKDNHEPSLTLTTTPSLDLGLNFYVDLDVLFDLVDGSVDVDAIFGLDMPIKIDPQHNPEVVISECFSTTLIFSWNFEVFCLPGDFICDALNDISGREVLLNEDTGSGCPSGAPASLAATPSGGLSQAILPRQTAMAYSESGAGLLAFTRNDSNGGAPPVLVVRPIDGGDFGRNADETVLSTAPGIRSVDLEFYQDNRAVIVWAESDRDYPTLSHLPPVQRLARQRLMYAIFDGEVWGTKRVLTTPSGGEGGVDLARCKSTATGTCPAAGELLAVWTRDTAGDLLQHRTRVYSSRFDPARGWTTPMAVDANAVLDSSPSAGYVDALPVVAFVRSTNGVFGDTQTRRIAYRFLNSSSNPVQVPAGLPAGAAWPSILGLDGGRFAIAHTYASDARAFIGNTQRVTLANADTCAAGVCRVTAQAVTDPYGRPIYGERPTALADEDGNVTVVMRGMGFGAGFTGTNVQPTDPIGMAFHTGEVVSFAIDPLEEIVALQPLSFDGAGHFAPSAVFDPALGQVVVASVRGTVIPHLVRSKYLATGAKPMRARAKGVEVDPGLTVFSAEQGVDFAIEAVTPQSATVTGGNSLRTDVLVRNAGTGYRSSLPGYQVRLSWDAPYDAGGVSVGTRPIPTLASGEAVTLSITGTVPTGFTPDQPHRLYATVFRNGTATDDVQGGNDQAYASFGGMPMPFGLNATAIRGSSMVQLTWDAIDDPQHLIAGYRVWCHDGNGQWRHLGSSFKLGFLDVAAPISVERHYRVTSYSRNTIESPPSFEAVATATLMDGVFASGFE